MKKVIELINITKTYLTGDIKFDALKKVNLTVNEGDFLAIMGPSRSGKSACMNIPGCLDEPTGNLDTKFGDEIMKIFIKLNQEGKTVVLITHEPDIAAFAKKTIHF